MRALQWSFWLLLTVGSLGLANHCYDVFTKRQAQKSDHADMTRIGRAMASYREKHGRLPPAVLYDSESGLPYSWRVALLPELGHQDLYDEYRRSEPWDGEHNRELLARMPEVYRSATMPGDVITTAYFAVTGPKTAFATSDGLGDPEITDSWETLVTVVSSRREILWTKPEDIEVDESGPLPELGGFHAGIFHAAMADGSARVLVYPSPFPEALMEMINAGDGRPLPCEF